MTGPATDGDATASEPEAGFDDPESGLAGVVGPHRAAALESYLAAELGVDVTGTEVLGDGLNLVVAVSTADDERAYVLRRPNKLRDAHYIDDVETEYEVLRRLDGTRIPTPSPVLLCDDESVLGDRFFVTTYLDGEPVPLGSALPERFRTASARERVANRLVDTLADVHSLDAAPFEGVCARRSPREQVVRTAERLDAASGVTGHEVPTLRSVAEWLRENAPAETGPTLLHGDFRPANVLFAGGERPTISGVLDWETALLGDPLTELGYLLLRWRDAGDPTPSLDGIAARHDDAGDALEHLQTANERGLAPFTAKPGSPTRREVVARYEARTGRSFGHGRFYRALAAFALATVWADLYRWSVEAGAEADEAASDWEPRIEYLGLLGECIVDGEFGL